MIVTICILSLVIAFFAVLSMFLFYGITEAGGMMDELRRYDREKSEVSNLQSQLIMEKFNFYLHQTERKLTDDIYENRKEIKDKTP